MGIHVAVVAGIVSGSTLIVIMSLVFLFVSDDSKESEWVSYNPKQCEDAPWISENTKFPSYNTTRGQYDATGYVAADYYRQQGITVYNYAVKYGGIVPAVCGYNAGYTVYLGIAKANTWRMQANGFASTNVPTDVQIGPTSSFGSKIALDFKKFVKYPVDDIRLTDDVIRKSVESASQEGTLNAFVEEHSGYYGLEYTAAYLDRYPGDRSKSAILLTVSVKTPIEEHPRAWVFLEPGSYAVLESETSTY